MEAVIVGVAFGPRLQAAKVGKIPKTYLALEGVADSIDFDVSCLVFMGGGMNYKGIVVS